MPSKLEWNGPKIEAAIHAEIKRRIEACSILVLNHWRKLISIEGAGKQAVTNTFTYRGVKKKVKAGTLLYGARPSAPGFPPHKQTGRLLGSTTYEVNDLIGRVGSTIKYLLWLELGTAHMAARPSLRRALAECLPQVRAILTRPMKL